MSLGESYPEYKTDNIRYSSLDGDTIIWVMKRDGKINIYIYNAYILYSKMMMSYRSVDTTSGFEHL